MNNPISIINITPQASRERLYEMLDKEADRRGFGLRHFCGSQLEKAIHNKEEYDKPLKKPLQKGGKAINIVVNESAKRDLKEWASKKNTSLGKHCAFLLEKWIEITGITQE